MSRIKINGLNVLYGRQPALRNISLDIPERQIIAIIGPSGCGKTTLLKSINRLLDLEEEINISGDIVIDNENIYADGMDVIALRKKVGFLPQRPYPLPMSIFNNVAFGPRLHGLDISNLAGGSSGRESTPRKKKDMQAIVERYLRLAGLWEEVKDRLHTPAAKLSIGQQQRLALARVLSVEPEIILADEPTSALDPISAKLVEEQFKSLKENYTIIFVTHILRQARRLADYIVFLYMGDLIEHEPAVRFFSEPRNEKTKAYITGEIS
ncbi:MAG TPA: phosphate ABC transporter ATP-binding protein [Deltaproteobacteria bacterium]|nr:phosphate ABC transporter ATP-binding protein [Deltaproteobacteria bacterium]